jgi:hypothetical protein
MNAAFHADILAVNLSRSGAPDAEGERLPVLAAAVIVDRQVLSRFQVVIGHVSRVQQSLPATPVFRNKTEG